MHPRNIYKKRLDFKILAEEFPEFKKVTTLDLKGQVSLDFKDVEALKILSKTLLKRDFNLEMHFPPDSLVPTIPLRLNYILFIEDLLNIIKRTNIRGIDIGTGASCIYPLIATKKNGWQMLGTDIDPDAIKYAQQNIGHNKLNHLIKGIPSLVQVKQNSVLKEVMEMDTLIYDFCMCNPPFFGDVSELYSQQKRKISRPAPKNAYCAKLNEVVTQGGELEFVQKMIDESTEFQSRIKIYSSMLGVKRNVKPLIAKLKQIGNVKSTVTTEFRQGSTTRYFIAWTYDESIDFTKIPNYTNMKKVKIKPYTYSLEHFLGTIENVDTRLAEIFDKLELRYTATRKMKEQILLYTVIASKNTWAHNRRKKREAARHAHDESSDGIMSKTANVTIETTAKGVIETNLLKRRYDDRNNAISHSNTKKLKLEKSTQNTFLECTVTVYVGTELCIELNYMNGLGGKDAAHQVLQYIKNHLEFE